MKQASQVQVNADFIITNFFQIEKLIFAHGFFSQLQTEKLIYFYMYKNIVIVACEILF